MATRKPGIWNRPKPVYACPFCGGEARVLHGGLRFKAAVECPECGGRIDRISEGDPVPEARAAWNRRAHDGTDKSNKSRREHG